jgi:hypothetical protein
MLQEMTTGRALRGAALLALMALWNQPALAKSKLQGEPLRLTCTGAFGDRDHFDWIPRMGIENALATCSRALAEFPDDAEVRFYNAVARDQFAERGGTQEDNLFATAEYRVQAENGMGIAQYALGTMFDEDSGVSTQDALSYMNRARAGEFGQSIRCEALRTFGQADLDGNGPSYAVDEAEQLAHGNYVCAAYLVGMYWSGYASAADLPLSVADYVRYAAVHGDPNAMAMTGLFYTFGTGSMEIDLQLQDQYTARRDPERAGQWLILAYWATRSSMRKDVHTDFWDGQHLQSFSVVEAMQTALKSLGHYDGEIDGNYLTPTQEALAAFEASDIDALFQAVRAKEKYDPSLGPREVIHIGDAALAGS